MCAFLCVCVFVRLRARVCVCCRILVLLFSFVVFLFFRQMYICHNIIIYLCLLMAKSMFSADFANKLWTWTWTVLRIPFLFNARHSILILDIYQCSTSTWSGTTETSPEYVNHHYHLEKRETLCVSFVCLFVFLCQRLYCICSSSCFIFCLLFLRLFVRLRFRLFVSVWVRFCSFAFVLCSFVFVCGHLCLV